MIETVFELAKTDCKTIEKVVVDENLHYLHMIFPQGDGLPEHYSNSNVYMTVIRGRLSIRLNEETAHEYQAGSLLKIPFQTKMNVVNQYSDVLELIVVKAPAPQM